jgi:hypothetical protein
MSPVEQTDVSPSYEPRVFPEQRTPLEEAYPDEKRGQV